ncbi:hypothetical protein Ae406Ps2_6399 [Pseudonocardia sp. Ae406_Ps2]|nr:hypothetical protein Ae406Ps2_6399 [Pseudonocardia sp. Ae406_Ps2]
MTPGGLRRIDPPKPSNPPKINLGSDLRTWWRLGGLGGLRRIEGRFGTLPEKSLSVMGVVGVAR